MIILREYLQDLLDLHIEIKLPKLRDEIKSLLKATEMELATLGNECLTIAHMRMFLTRRSMEYHGLAQAALDGNSLERDPDFLDNTLGRLRAEVRKFNGAFATYMRKSGQKQKLSSQISEGVELASGLGTGPIPVNKAGA